MREREITRKVKNTTVSNTFCASPAGGYACLLTELWLRALIMQVWLTIHRHPARTTSLTVTTNSLSAWQVLWWDEEPTGQEGDIDQPPTQEQATTSTSTNQIQSKLAQHCAQVLGLKPAVLEFDHRHQLARLSHATAGMSNFSTASKQTLQGQETIFREGVLAIYTDLKGVDRRTNEDARTKKYNLAKKLLLRYWKIAL